MKKTYKALLNRLDSSQKSALATITEVKGSAPQKAGSTALFGMNGLVEGTIGGGALEMKVREIVGETLANSQSGYYSINNISILIDCQPDDNYSVFKAMAKSISAGKKGNLITRILHGEQGNISIKREWIEGEIDRARINQDAEEVFIESISPLPLLVIVGAGHVGKELCRVASRLEFDISVIDERKEFANNSNLPHASKILCGKPGEILREINLDGSYIVIASHSHDDDAEAMAACIKSNSAYIGMIGSRRKISGIKDKFLTDKIASPEQWEKIHAPVGLEINAVTVEEIAISIAAELIDVRSKKDQNNS